VMRLIFAKVGRGCVWMKNTDVGWSEIIHKSDISGPEKDQKIS
jgi:hypothetical protein